MTRKQRSVAVALAALAVAAGSPAAAQEAPGTIAQVVVTRVKPGMGKQYQEGRKRHVAWHKRQSDPWSWHTWQVTSGPDTGHYVTVTFGHHWKDFDTWEGSFGEGDSADVELNLDPHAEATTVAYFDLLADVSRPAASPTPARMSEVVHFFLKPGQSQQLGVGLAFGLGYAAIYLGAAQGALDFTVEYSRTHRFDPDPATLAESLVIQRNVAEMSMALEGARLVLYQSACRWPEGNPLKRAVLAARAKFLATEAALMATARAIQCVGGRSAHKRYPLERMFRDVRTCTLMPPNVDRTMEIIGKAQLGISDGLGLADREG